MSVSLVCYSAIATHAETSTVLSNSTKLPDTICATFPHTHEVTNEFCNSNLRMVEYASMHNSHLNLYLIAILEKH